VLGLLAAWSYERGQRLLAPMLVHALYNAALVSWQLWA
jgi:membrane protease YdiL (CAAX protease family)